MRHSRRAYEDRNETDYVLHRIHGLARQISRASGAIRQHRVDRADLGRLDQPRMRHGGGRAPHLWLDDEYSLYDMFGFEFTLLRLGAKPPDATPLRAPAKAERLPLKIQDINIDEARDLYGADLALVRPDQIVAWRGNVVADAVSALKKAAGHACA